ncbi:MAG: SUMF1/EgtB/PvdO family nonheme iron enzyme [Nitrospira sp.]|nr:SUMF1/EgtB/PvdO family nonheme iron enzyme [Nitrospira sp.]
MSTIQDILQSDSILREQWLPVEVAADLVVAFEERFGTAALELACHASVPLVVDADMVQLIRQNFLSQAPLSWVAEADLLLSPLCRPIGGACYQFEPRVRECLLVDLEDRFGSNRQGWIAEWVLAFGDSPVSQGYPPEVKHTHRWIGLAYTHPEALLEEMSATVQMPQAPSASSWAIAGQIQVATTLEMVKDVLEQRMGAQANQLQDLSQQAKLLSFYWYGDREALQRQIQEEAQVEQETEAGSPSSLSVVIDWIKGQPSQGKEEAPLQAGEEELPKAAPPHQLPPNVEDELASGNVGSFEPAGWLEPLVEEWVIRIHQEQPTIVRLIGKSGPARTRVVRALAEALASHYPDGLVYVDGRKRPKTLDEMSYLATAVLNALEPQESVGSQPLDYLFGAYRQALHHRSVCVVVDYVGPVEAGVTDGLEEQSKVSKQSRYTYIRTDLPLEMEPSSGNVLLTVETQVPVHVSTALVLDLDADRQAFLKQSNESPTQEGEIIVVHGEGIGMGYQDKPAVRRIVQRLRLLRPTQDVEVWNTRRVFHEPGGDQQFTKALEAARAVVLLVTPHLLKQKEGNFIHLVYESAQRLAGKALERFFPVLMEPCDASDLTLIRGMSFQLWPRHGQALSTMDESRRMMEWQLIMGEIRRTLQEPRKAQESAEPGTDHEASVTTGLYDIAVTYAGPDSERVAPLVKGLKAEGWTVYSEFPEMIGVYWAEDVRKVINSAKIQLLIVTDASCVSEYQMAPEMIMGRFGMTKIPVILDDLPFHPSPINHIQGAYLQKWNGDFQDDLWQKFTKNLHAILGSSRSQSPKSPPKGMVLIPKGPFLYGDDKREVTIDHDYYMDIYPVTNADYQKFIEAGGYDKQSHWSQEGWKWRKTKKVTKPEKWDDEQFNGPDQPVVRVSYYEAEAYAAWTGKRLPTEQEWEKAARGTDGRTYPWGEEFDADLCANSVGKKNPDRPAPMGSYLDGQSPFGCQDMAGNVWEWCASWYHENKERRVLRGGSWVDLKPKDFCCYEYRGDSPRYRDYFFGFRCAQDAP